MNKPTRFLTWHHPQQTAIALGLATIMSLLAACQSLPVITQQPNMGAASSPVSTAASTAATAGLGTPNRTGANKTAKTPNAHASPLPSATEPPLSSQPLPHVAPAKKPITASLPPQPRTPITRDGRHIPAVTHLIAMARQQIADQQWDNAEQSLTQAQRLAPNHPAIYAYLSNIALQQQQGKRAEAMARHGLMLSQSVAQQRAFWQLIELAAQQQRNPKTLLEAQRAISNLP